jgi:uncharacterized protein with von Willebrand factor type A (vWA) domain
MRTERSGSLALLRDTSMSMTGVWNEWARSLALQIVALGQAQSMRIGYMEFNHNLKKVMEGEGGEDRNFFNRDYELLVREINRTECAGVTNYQLPLSNALAEFALSTSRKHDRHILFLTDGLPTSGCKHLAAETAQAVELGVAVHTLFIGSKAYPEILSKLSEATRGVQFRATYDQGLNSINVTQRKPGDL